MKITALNYPNPADAAARPAYEATEPMPEFHSKPEVDAMPPAMPRKFGRLVAGLSPRGKAQRGRRRKYMVEDLVECIAGAKLSTNQFRAAANKRCGMSRAMFYRLLEIGRNESRLQQCGGTSKLWEAV